MSAASRIKNLLKAYSLVGKLGFWFVAGGTFLALISALIFVTRVSGETNLCFDIDPTVWGQFGDFLGGTWGILLTAGSALLIIETIQKQDKHEQMRSFESRLHFLISAYQDRRKSELSELKASANHLVANFNRINPPSLDQMQRMEYSYYMTFGKTLNGLPMTPWEILAKIRYQDDGSTANQILGEMSEQRFSPSSDYSHFDLLLLILGIYERINEEVSLSFEVKLKYGEQMRLLLSEEELILIAAFSFTHIGADFEQTGYRKSDANFRLITKYSIIRNLAVNIFGQGVLQNLFEDIHFSWMESPPESRKALKFS